MITQEDMNYLKQAIDNSRKSFEQGNFPAGAVVVKDGKILASEVSVPYPGLLHADSKALIKAYEKIGNLKGATLYIGVESCLMCTGIAYWSGIRRVVFAIPKSKVSGDYYETPLDTHHITDNLNEKIEFLHVPELEEKALKIIRLWENTILQQSKATS